MYTPKGSLERYTVLNPMEVATIICVDYKGCEIIRGLLKSGWYLSFNVKQIKSSGTRKLIHHKR